MEERCYLGIHLLLALLHRLRPGGIIACDSMAPSTTCQVFRHLGDAIQVFIYQQVNAITIRACASVPGTNSLAVYGLALEIKGLYRL